MPSSEDTLAMLSRAQELGLLPKSMAAIEVWEGSWSGPCAHIGVVEDVLFIVAVDRDEHDGVLGDLQLHLASRNLRCTLQPAQTAARDADAPWWEVQPTRIGGMLIEGGVPYFDAPEHPGVLGLLAAAVKATEWRLAREAEVR